jgi:LuxR family maltose regulon positive regulatory protein
VSPLARHGPPAINRPAVVRPRLLDAMQGRFERRVTALVAGPGFGKSTLLAQALAENQLSPRGIDVWLGCSADDAAVSELTFALLSRLGSTVGSHGPTEGPTDPRTAARTVADAVWSRAPTQVALVLDDAQAVPRGSPGHRMLAALVDVLPANGHLVIACRHPVVLPLTRLVAAGEAQVLDEPELSFGVAELAEFAARRNVPAELLDGIGGWPALAELTATAGRRQVADYLWEEVLEGISEDRRDLLAVLAGVGGADDALASELLHVPTDLRALLDGLPLVSATPEGWWSLHPLWDTALGSRVQAPPVVDARRRAAAALRRRGLTRESMRLLLEVAAWDDVRELAVEICSGLTPAVHADVLAQWRDRLPDEIRNTPEGLLLTGTAAKGDDPWTAARLLRDAVAGFRAAGHVAAEVSCLQSLFHILFWHNDLAGMQQIMVRWDELAREGDAEAAAAGSLGRALLAADPTQAQAELEQVPHRPYGPLGPIADWLRAHILLLTLGDPERAASWARQALPRAPSTLRSSIRCELVESLRLQGRAADAEAEVAALLDDVDAGVVRSPRHLAVALVLNAFLGRTAQIDRLLPALRSSVEASHLPWAPIAGVVGEAACAVAVGDEPRAAALLRQVAGHRMARPWVLLRICPATLPLYYLLVPESRAEWDTTDLRGAFGTAHRLAQALVAIRERDGTPDPLAVDPADLMLAPAHLPVPWTTELGVGLAARGRPEGSALVRALGPGARPTLRGIEESAAEPLAQVARRMLARVPALPRHRLAVSVLGPLVVARDGEEVDDANVRRERVRQLLGYLVVHHRVSRVTASTMLWPDLDETVAARNLRVTLNYLQNVLEPDRDERDAPFFLRTRGTTLELVDDAALEVDAWAFEKDLQEADRAEHQGAPSVALEANLRAVERYRGDLLPDLTRDEWASHERDRLRRRYLTAALRAGNLLLARSDTDRPEDLATRTLAAEPWSEQAYQLLIATLLARGDRAAARRALDQCFEMLDELGAQASAETLDLVQQIKHGIRPPAAAGVASPRRPQARAAPRR